MSKNHIICRNILLKIFVAVFILSIFTSCNENFRVKVIQNDGTPLSKLLFVSYCQNVYGIDYENLDCHVHLKLNTFTSQPLVYNNQIFFGDNGTDIGKWGNSVFVLDSSFKFKTQIESVPNIYRLSVYDNYLIASSACYFGGDVQTGLQGGFSLIDLSDLKNILIYEKLPGMLNNSGNCYGYKNNLYLSTSSEKFIENSNKISRFSLDNFEISEVTSLTEQEFQTEYSPEAVINKNHLWVSYFECPIIDVFYLGTNEKIKRIDLRKYFTEFKDECITSPEKNNFWFNHSFVHDDVYYIDACKRYGNETDGNYIFLIDSNSFELIRILPIDAYIRYLYDIKVVDEYSDYLFLNFGNRLMKVSAKTGQIEKEIIF